MGRRMPCPAILSLLETLVPGVRGATLQPTLSGDCMPYPCTSPGLAPALGSQVSARCRAGESDGEAEPTQACWGMSRAGEQTEGKGAAL